MSASPDEFSSGSGLLSGSGSGSLLPSDMEDATTQTSTPSSTAPQSSDPEPTYPSSTDAGSGDTESVDPSGEGSSDPMFTEPGSMEPNTAEPRSTSALFTSTAFGSPDVGSGTPTATLNSTVPGPTDQVASQSSTSEVLPTGAPPSTGAPPATTVNALPTTTMRAPPITTAEAPPTTQPSTIFYLEITLSLTVEEYENGVEEALLAMIKNELKLEENPTAAIIETDPSIIIKIKLGTSEEEIRSFALQLLTSTNPQWLRFRDVNVCGFP